jgi:hypothetical protein
MNASTMVRATAAIAFASLVGGCSTWDRMDKQEQGMAIGGASGAVVGAAVGGPVGAVIGAGAGGYVGHEGVGPDRSSTASTYGNDSALVRSVQQSLNDRGYSAGPADGQWGPNTESALRQFQAANGLAQTGSLDDRTLSTLGVSR